MFLIHIQAWRRSVRLETEQSKAKQNKAFFLSFDSCAETSVLRIAVARWAPSEGVHNPLARRTIRVEPWRKGLSGCGQTGASSGLVA